MFWTFTLTEEVMCALRTREKAPIHVTIWVLQLHSLWNELCHKSFHSRTLNKSKITHFVSAKTQWVLGSCAYAIYKHLTFWNVETDNGPLTLWLDLSEKICTMRQKVYAKTSAHVACHKTPHFVQTRLLLCDVFGNAGDWSTLVSKTQGFRHNPHWTRGNVQKK